jgi:hypothetical protein
MESAELGTKDPPFSRRSKKDLESWSEKNEKDSRACGERTCSGAGGAGAAEALLLDDEADPDEGGGGDGEERALEVGGEEVAAGVRHREAHRAGAARGRRI